MEDWNYLELTDIDQLPNGHGTYAFMLSGEVVYIGRSKCLWRRIKEHVLWKPWIKPLLQSSGCCLYYSVNHSDYDREKELIQSYRPQLNVAYLISAAG